jgi:hypothetical protein
MPTQSLQIDQTFELAGPVMLPLRQSCLRTAKRTTSEWQKKTPQSMAFMDDMAKAEAP